MKLLITIALLLLVGGCSGSGDPDGYYIEGRITRVGVVNLLYAEFGNALDPCIGSFDTYAEARAECDRLNGEAMSNE